MKRVRLFIPTFLMTVLFSIISAIAFAEIQVIRPVCEYLENPVGIDVEKPRMSWQIVSFNPGGNNHLGTLGRTKTGRHLPECRNEQF